MGGYKKININEIKSFIVYFGQNQEFANIEIEHCGRIALVPVRAGNRKYLEVLTLGWPIMLYDVDYEYAYITDGWGWKKSETLCNELMEMFPYYILVDDVYKILYKISQSWPYEIKEAGFSYNKKDIVYPDECKSVEDLRGFGPKAILKLQPDEKDIVYPDEDYSFHLLSRISNIVENFEFFTNWNRQKENSITPDGYWDLKHYMDKVNIFISQDIIPSRYDLKRVRKLWLDLSQRLLHAESIIKRADKSGWSTAEVNQYNLFQKNISELHKVMSMFFVTDKFHEVYDKAQVILNLITDNVLFYSNFWLNYSPRERFALQEILSFIKRNENMFNVSLVTGFFIRSLNAIVLYVNPIDNAADRYKCELEDMMVTVLAHESFHAMHWYEIKQSKRNKKPVEYWEGNLELKCDRDTVIEGLARTFEYYSAKEFERLPEYTKALENNNNCIPYPDCPYSAANGLINIFITKGYPASFKLFSQIYMDSLKDWDQAYKGIDKANK